VVAAVGPVAARLKFPPSILLVPTGVALALIPAFAHGEIRAYSTTHRRRRSQSRIPAPLPPPAQPPVINGPLSQPAFRPL